MMRWIRSLKSRTCVQIFGCLAVAGVLACTENAGSGKPPNGEQAAPEGPSTPAAEKPTGDLPDAEALLAESVTAMGGADKFDALSGYFAESQLSMGGLGLTGVAKTWWTRDGFYTETEMPGVGLMKIGGQGGKVWGDDPINGLRTLAAKEAEQAGWSSTLCLAHEWKKHFKTAKTVAVKPGDGGKKLAEIELVSPLADKVVLRIDLETKLPVSQSFTQANPLGDMPATVTFEDYRDVSGLKLPFKQVVDASLMKAVSTTTKVELNPSVADVPFAMPGSGSAVTPGAPVEAVKPDAKAETKATDKKKKGKPAP